MGEDKVSAKKLMLKALKKAPAEGLALAKLKKQVVAKLVAAGKSEPKAAKLVDAKLAEACFTLEGKSVRLSNGTEGSKRPAEEPQHAPAKKLKPDQSQKPGKKPPAAEPAAAAVPACAAAAIQTGAVKMMSASEASAYCEANRIELTGSARDGSSAGAAFRPIANFADAGFAPDVLATCAKFERPTPIQSCCWPIILAGRDVVGVAETGSGKTFAFFLPAIRLAGQGGKAKGANVKVLVLAPTRELAMQTESVCKEAGEKCGVKSICIYGGVPKGPQYKALNEGASVVVATPGRLLDLHSEGACPLGEVKYLVLDEADRMLDMGFEKDVRAIIEQTPPKAERMTVMFTATWPESVRQLAEEFLNDPVRVNVGSDALTANHRVTQHVHVMEQEGKEPKLFELLKHHKPSSKHRVLVFALYKKEAARVEQTLLRRGHECIAIHGDQTQAMRTSALDKFKRGECPLLVATDVAARGLDIPMVELVVNFTFPLTIEDYVHRIGRTGRGGKTGIAHTFFTTFDKAHAGALQNILREAKQEVPDALMKFGSAVKKKEHKMYGNFSGSGGPMKAPTKIVFSDD